MITTKFLVVAAIAILPVILAGPANAVDSRHASQFVIAHANDFIDEKLTEDQESDLQMIAHQAAVAAICDGFALDETKFVAAFGKLEHDAADDMSAEEKDYFEKHLLVVYGVLVGGFLAEAAGDTGGYCADAAEDRADPDFAAVSLWE